LDVPGGTEYAQIPATVRKPMPSDLDAKGNPLYKSTGDYLQAHDAWQDSEITRRINEQLYEGYGLSIFIEETGQPVRPDKLHPTPEMKLEEAQSILKDAMNYAGIEVNSSGSGYDRSKDALYILVGHRPREIGNQPPTLYKIGRWVEGLGR
jgi:hypothetical protein